MRTLATLIDEALSATPEPTTGDWSVGVKWADPIARRDGCLRAERERIAKWHDACRAGQCRYVERGAPDRPQIAANGGCPGYLGVEYVEHGQPVFRYRACDRFRVWWEYEREQSKRRRATEAQRLDAARKPGVGGSWRRGEEE